MKSNLQFSMRELLFVVAFAGLGVASLANGGIIGAIMISLAMAVTMGLAIIALVNRGSRQAFAIGFLTPVVMYAGALLAAGRNEFDPDTRQLPTSMLLRPIFEVMSKKTVIDAVTGEVVPGANPTDVSRVAMTYGSSLRILESRSFMSLGHLLIAMILGYAGAKFAVIVHRRESKDNESRAGECD